MNKSQWASQETRKYYEDQERARNSSPDNYKILRQRIQEYIAKLSEDSKNEKAVGERRGLLSCLLVSGIKEKLANDLSDILQTFPNE